MDISISFSTIIGFALYSVTLGMFFIRSKVISEKAFWIALTAFSIFNLGSGLVTFSTMPFIYFVFIACHYIDFKKQSLLSNGSYYAIALLSLLLAIHLIPGFNNERIFGPTVLDGSNLPYQLYANIDKAYGALILIYLHYFRLDTLKIHIPNQKELVYGYLGITAIFSLALLMGSSWSIKFGQLTWAFLFFNLFVTCVAEEAFFRLVIQEGLYRHLPSKWQQYTAPLITSLIFMLAHFHTGDGATERLTLIFLAGLVYALVYQQRRSLVSAIVIHFLLNILHFSFFSYPASF